MKQILLAGLLSLTMIMGAGSAMALTLNDRTTEIGEIDNILEAIWLPNSGDDTVVDWINGYFRTTSYIASDLQSTQVTALDWEQVGDKNSSIFAQTFLYATDWFVIKTGNVTVDDNARHYLFNNNVALDWAVIDLGPAGMIFELITNIGGVSHVSASAPVPEPATMLLFGTGLVGLAGARARRKKK